MELLVSQSTDQSRQSNSRRTSSSGIVNPAATLDLEDTVSIISDISKVPRVPGDGAAQVEDADQTCSVANLELRKQERLPSLALQNPEAEIRIQPQPPQPMMSNGNLRQSAEARSKSKRF